MKCKDLQKPCHDCAFRRDSTPGHLGGSEAEVYIGQIHGPFYIPCHLTYARDEQWREKLHDTGSCAGAAVFRANLGVDRMTPHLHRLPADHAQVFSSSEEFMAHHQGISIEQAREKLRRNPPEKLLMIELGKAQVRRLDLRTKREIST